MSFSTWKESYINCDISTAKSTFPEDSKRILSTIRQCDTIEEINGSIRKSLVRSVNMDANSNNSVKEYLRYAQILHFQCKFQEAEENFRKVWSLCSIRPDFYEHHESDHILELIVNFFIDVNKIHDAKDFMHKLVYWREKNLGPQCIKTKEAKETYLKLSAEYVKL